MVNHHTIRICPIIEQYSDDQDYLAAEGAYKVGSRSLTTLRSISQSHLL